MSTRTHTRRMAGRARVALGALALSTLLGGCLKDPTEIVIVADSDLTPFVDFDVIEFIGFPHFPDSFGRGTSTTGNQWATATKLPATLGIVPQEFAAQNFDVMVTASRGFDVNGQRMHLVTRRVSNISFVPDQQRAVFITLLRECKCTGTNCPNDDVCKDVTAPVLLPFDEENIPHL